MAAMLIREYYIKSKKSAYQKHVDKYGKEQVDKGLDQLLKDIDDMDEDGKVDRYDD